MEQINKNLEQNSILNKNNISNEKEIFSKKIERASYVSEIQKEIWEIKKIKETLKKEKRNFIVFEQKLKELGEKHKNNENISDKEKNQIKKLLEFYNYFSYINSLEIKTEIEKTPDTKKEILIIGQTHFHNSYYDNYEVLTKIGHSQNLIDIYKKYFLDENLIIGKELSGANSFDNSDKYKTYEIIFYLEKISEKFPLSEKENNLIKKFIKNKEITTLNGEHFNKKDDENLFEKICFLKYYIYKIKKENPKFLESLNYGRNKKNIINIEYSPEENIYVNDEKYFDYDFLNKENLNENHNELIEDLKNLTDIKLKDFFLFDFENFLEKYIGENGVYTKQIIEKIKVENEKICNDNIKEYIDTNEKTKKELMGKYPEEYKEYEKLSYNLKEFDESLINSIKEFHEYLLEQNLTINKYYINFLNSVFQKLKEREFEINSKVDVNIFLHLLENNIKFILEDNTFFQNISNNELYKELKIFFKTILKLLYYYFIHVYREEKVIENIEKFFPKNQKQIPIIFGAGHNENWKAIIEKHNKENPENQYSLKIINLEM